MMDEEENPGLVGHDDSGGGTISPEAGQAMVDDLMADPEFNAAYFDADHMGHASAVRRMAEVRQRMYGGDAQKPVAEAFRTKQTGSEALGGADTSRDYGDWDDLRVGLHQATDPEFESKARAAFTAIDLEPADGRSLVHLNNLLAEGRLDMPADMDAAAEALQRQFGPGAEAALADAQKLVRTMPPWVAAYLDDTGLGNHPAVVSIIAMQAARLKRAGRL